ncbi:pteridine-dependent deoxygenase [Montanilutibacter psychrotolerans]|uniref:chorismate transformation enzyme, FkbO/Hyg5 family n=1 Tax=Montanilutibacter psychrotolerans TaxID=1327343 RepID=UPI001680EF2E|nr:pteridine-dependent deoxygenase [Lysobacter psychrotolerans]
MAHGPHPVRLSVDYVDGDPAELLARPDTLALFGFGSHAPVLDDPRYLRVALEPHGAAPLELWRAGGPVRHGRIDGLAWAEDGELLFGALELDEGTSEIDVTAETIYRRLRELNLEHGYPHLLRTWNYLDGITHGEGDIERYRVFCVGRARGIGDAHPAQLPAATAIGRVDNERRLQVYWLAARAPGNPLENPRQVSAYRYPRQYGPQPPSFARAMLPPTGAEVPLLLSGTAAVVGHESRHADSVAAQLDETLANFDSLLAVARARQPQLQPRFGATSCLKVYVRDRDEIAQVTALLEQRLDPAVQRLVLHAAICRRELRVEIDGVHG